MSDSCCASLASEHRAFLVSNGLQLSGTSVREHGIRSMTIPSVARHISTLGIIVPGVVGSRAARGVMDEKLKRNKATDEIWNIPHFTNVGVDGIISRVQISHHAQMAGQYMCVCTHAIA